MLCKKCPRGHMCPTAMSASPVPCTNGTYSNTNGSVVCKICPAGYSCLVPHQTPVSCIEGFYSPLGIPQCLPCPQGYR